MSKKDVVIAEYTDFCEDYTSLCARAFPGDERFTDEGMRRVIYALYARLVECSAKFNLTAILESRAVAEKHIVDSLMLLYRLERNGALKEGDRLMDIGAGAGFPSLPLAAASASGLFPMFSVLAVDSSAKKIAYIKETAELLGLDTLRAETGRAEDLAGTGLRGKFDIVTARAVASLPIIVELGAPFLKVGGIIAAMKANVEDEITAAAPAAKKLGLTEAKTDLYSLPSGDARSLVIYKSARPAGREYPRQYAKILREPLT